jgi:hypothetical protein
MISLAVVPTYAVARFVLPRRGAVAVVALAALAPLAMYSGLLLSETLAYLLFLTAVWAMLEAIRKPRPLSDLVLLVAIVAATTARLQLVALVPTALLAIAIVAVVGAKTRDTRVGLSLWRELSGHRTFLVPVVLAAAAAIARSLSNGGRLPLAGRYANVGNAHAGAFRVLALAVQHLAGLDFAVGIAPFAAALLGAHLLVRSRFPTRGLIFSSVAASATLFLLLEVAFDAAAFDTGPGPATARGLPPDVPRFHERYLIYLIPLFLVAFIALLRRSRLPLLAVVSCGSAAALLPIAIPFGRDINNSIVADSFSFQIFGVSSAGRPIHSVPGATTAALVISAVLAAVFVLATLRGYRRTAFATTALVFVLLSNIVWIRLHSAANGSTTQGLPAHKDWVDRVVGKDASVVLVGGRGIRRVGLLQTAFYNLTIERVYDTCLVAFGGDFGERRLTLNSAGVLADASRQLVARYAVVPTRFDVRGRRLARDPDGGLELVAPLNDRLVVAPRSRAAARCAD